MDTLQAVKLRAICIILLYFGEMPCGTKKKETKIWKKTN